jgi:hypothetical protein
MGFRSFRALASKRCSRATLFVALVGSLGCTEGTAPFSVVDRLRVAAVANEPLRPQPGLPISVSVLTLREANDETPITVLMTGCVLAGPTQACGPGTQPLTLLPSGEPVIEKSGDNLTGGRTDTWQAVWPETGFGAGLVNAVVINCSLPDDADPTALEGKLEELLEQGETEAPEGWECAENPLRLSRSVWIARHRIDPPQTEGEPLQNLRPTTPVMRRADDQKELEAGIVRTYISTETEGSIAEAEPRWFWYTTAPQGVVMRVSASEGGETKALVATDRTRDYTYWVVARDSAGRTGWNHFVMTQDMVLEP